MRQLFFICFFSFVCLAGYSQNDYMYESEGIVPQFGISGGLMNCITDLGGKSNVMKTFKPAGGFYIGAMYNQAIGARLEINWGTVTAADRNSKKAGTQGRNLSFTSAISDISLLAEINPLHFSSSYTSPFSFYLLAGVGNFSFNPKTKLNGQYVFLQPLHTEGQTFPETGREEYKLNQFMIPLGGGLSYDISSRFTIKGELVYRVLNTDYLDDVSTTFIDPALFDKYMPPATASLAKELYFRADEVNPQAVAYPGGARGSKAKDSYYSLNLKIQVNLGK